MRLSKLAGAIFAPDVPAFLAVAEERSFTRAAGRLGTTPSAITKNVQRLEARTGLRLVARTTRSVALTEAGKGLIETLGAMLDDVDQRLGEFIDVGEDATQDG